MGEQRRRNLMGIPPRQMQVDGSQLKDRVCPCGGMLFTDALTLKELPALVSPTGKVETAMFKVGFICVACGKLMPLRPEEPKEDKPTIELIGGNGGN